MNVFFMGTPEFAAVSLRALLQSSHKVTGVITRPDKPQGRHFTMVAPPVKDMALQAGVPVYQPETLKDGKAEENIFRAKPDIVVVVAYGRLLPAAILTTPPLGCVNLHASLLPKYRGAAPIQWSIINGETETGVTTMHMTSELDAGDIILYECVAIGADDTAGQLHDKLAPIGARTLLKTLEALDKGTAPRRAQNHGDATYAPALKKSDGALDMSMPPRSLYNRIRGLTPHPGAYIDGLRVHKASMEHGNLSLLEVQPPGGVRMGYESYLRGKR
ncbi:MAG: methionyl-tRNA formyltransferase [Oscillospiraceae bacterium]|jgi:methionyl-tRNA formyltransferase|nr:methionyl-tRNA formyltransferase [Oscillospiraceae bacterium]